MTTDINRRIALGLLAASPLLASPMIAMAETAPVEGDVVMGSDDAPVTVVEYASFTCPHCARFHTGTFPELKENYIDTGKVKFILREVYFDQYGMIASVVARCGGADAFYPITDQILKTQDKWSRAPQDQIVGELRKIGRVNGLSNEALDACLSNQDFAKKLFEDFQTNASADKVESTPTFIINGEKESGNMPYPEFAALIDKHL
ncbi:DsbA family protein [Rhodobacteraceae bacterium NNCM2]|nr:DsbA family protein [Coraliihabitans acroporae]